MIKTATVAFTHYASDGRVRRMAEALAERGDDVTAITLREENEPRRYELAGVKVRTVNLKQHRGSNQVLYIAQYVIFLLIAALLLTVSHMRRRFDVVHINNMPDFMVFAALPVKVLGAKVILDIHDPMPELFESKFGFGKGHMLGRFGYNEDGERVFFGTYINRSGQFMGLLGGTWEPVEDRPGHGRFIGHWTSDGETRDGALGGRYLHLPERPGGFYQGRWATDCDPDAVDDIAG